VSLPLGGAPVSLRVAGVWRDYARQHGAVVLTREDYIAITGDQGANDVAISLAPGADAAEVLSRIRSTLPALAAMDWRSAGEIRTLSMRVFDRSFAVTYVLEAIAIFGIERCMFASNFPVAGLRVDYDTLVRSVARMVSGFSAAQRHAFFVGNAARFYRLDVEGGTTAP
jgi:hypothetical protein